MSITVDNFREEAPKFLFERLSRGRNALLDAPPGLGKTRNAAKVAIRLVKEAGQRVLIIEPTKTLRSIVADYIRAEDKDIEINISRGNDDYTCPLTETKANLCSERKEQCRLEKKNCGVLKDNEKTLNSTLTIATFPKLLLSKGLFKGYNTILIDESHGFENAENNYLQTYIMLSKLEEVSNNLSSEHPQLAQKLGNLHNGLSRMSEMLGDSSPLTLAEVDTVRKEFADTTLRDAWLTFTRDNKHNGYNLLYRNISTLNFQMGSINKNVFFFYKGALYGRPKNMEAEISGFFKDKNVGLLSATIDDPLRHAKSCGLDMRRFSLDDGAILKDYPDVRRKNRKLIALKDGPSLGRADEQYDDSRKQANEIIANLVTKFKERTLVLFRGYNDQKLAGEYLDKLNFSGRIHNVWQGEDPETIEAKLKKLKESDIVLCSAAARLWEGIDVPNLRLLIIDALPYPSKDPLDSEYDFRASHMSMVKKLKQGLGRIVRSDDDWGIAVVIDKRFSDKFKGISKNLPWFMGDDFQTLTIDNAFKEIDGFMAQKRGLIS
jgi:Rad3-related DNA helicase